MIGLAVKEIPGTEVLLSNDGSEDFYDRKSLADRAACKACKGTVKVRSQKPGRYDRATKQ